LATPRRDVRLASGLLVCGDHRDNASINGAMVSGRRAAEAILEA
jgi:predicted NAD/FAD-dependent oxidoreductase